MTSVRINFNAVFGLATVARRLSFAQSASAMSLPCSAAMKWPRCATLAGDHVMRATARRTRPFGYWLLKAKLPPPRAGEGNVQFTVQPCTVGQIPGGVTAL